MTQFTLYTANTIGDQTNTFYPNKVDITDEKSLMRAASSDHVAAEYKGNRRGNDNFMQADCLPLDCDNTHSENSKNWVTPFEVELAFPDVAFAVVYSRNHMKPKDNQTARPRFHVYFPISPIRSASKYAKLKQQVWELFPYFDKAALDSSRFLYGVEKPEVNIYDGQSTISDYLDASKFEADDEFANWDTAQSQIQEGSRNNTLSHIAGKLVKRYGNTEESYRLFLKANEKCNPPLEDSELHTIWGSAVQFGKKVALQEGYVPPELYNADLQLLPTDFSDVGQAKVLAREYGDTLRFTPKLGFLVYDGSYWKISEEDAVGIAQELTDRQLEEAATEMAKVKEEMKINGTLDLLATVGPKKALSLFNHEQSSTFKKFEAAEVYQKYAIKRRDSRYIKSALAMAEPHLPIEIETLDDNEFLLNTPSATYDLRTGLPQKHEPLDFITQLTSIDPGDEGAKMWQDALNLVFCHDRALMEYVQKIVGLAAIGKIRQEALIIAYGEGQNGKSTFWNAIFRVLGSYAGALSSEILKFVEVYTDDGISATSTKRREGFKRMIADALGGRIDLIVTKSVSRFARNTVDSLTTVRQLKEKGIEIYFEKENIWTLDSKGELLITIMSSLAQEESRSISENCTWGQRKRFADGKVTVPFNRFLGYDRGEDGDLVVNPEQAKTVKRIYGLFLKGKSPHMIAHQLTDDGISTPGGKTKWSTQSVRSILTNEKYKGDALLQKSYTVDFLTKEKKANEGEIPQYYVKGNHEAIIEPEVFDLVQKQMALRKMGKNRLSSVNIFSSKIICGDCGSWYGSKVWHSNDQYRRVVWLCNHKFSGTMKCQTPHLTEDEIKELFIKAANQLIKTKGEILAHFQEIKDTLFSTQKLEKEQSRLESEVNIVAEMIQDCISENAKVALDQAAYEERYNALVERFDKAKAKYDKHSQTILEKQARGEQVEAFLDELEKLDLITEFDEDVWLSLVESITVRSKKDVSITFKDGTKIKVA
ncbi:MAG: recombinase family protein [Streptococcaceae bacterium]|nr:recombinase family protein [Streptococcaceae bacterium]